MNKRNDQPDAITVTALADLTRNLKGSPRPQHKEEPEGPGRPLALAAPQADSESSVKMKGGARRKKRERVTLFCD
eukprot:798419-Rhodomonas_salina.1